MGLSQRSSIEFTHSGDSDIAYDSTGTGTDTVLIIPGWISQLEIDRAQTAITAFTTRLAQHRRIIHFDRRGTGLSFRDPSPDRFALSLQADDILSVLDAAGVEKAHLLSWFYGSLPSIAFAATYPERTAKIVLINPLMRWHILETGERGGISDAIRTLAESSWSSGSYALAAALVANPDSPHIRWLAAQHRAGIDSEGAALLMTSLFSENAESYADQVNAETLLIRHQHCAVIPAALTNDLAAHLSSVQIAEVSGNDTLPFFGESRNIVGKIDGFLGTRSASELNLTPREEMVIRLLAHGYSNRDIARRLSLSEATVARHLGTAYGKLGVSGRPAAAVAAFRLGIVGTKESDDTRLA